MPFHRCHICCTKGLDTQHAVMPLLKEGDGARCSQDAGNIPTRVGARSADSNDPEVIVKLRLDVIDASARLNRLIALIQFAKAMGIGMDSTTGLRVYMSSSSMITTYAVCQREG